MQNGEIQRAADSRQEAVNSGRLEEPLGLCTLCL